MTTRFTAVYMLNRKTLWEKIKDSGPETDGIFIFETGSVSLAALAAYIGVNPKVTHIIGFDDRREISEILTGIADKYHGLVRYTNVFPFPCEDSIPTGVPRMYVETAHNTRRQIKAGLEVYLQSSQVPSLPQAVAQQ